MQEIRKLTVTGNGKTYYVTIPRWMIKELQWQKGQKVELQLKGNKVTIKDWEKKPVPSPSGRGLG